MIPIANLSDGDNYVEKDDEYVGDNYVYLEMAFDRT